jgi:hypothetical protein
MSSLRRTCVAASIGTAFMLLASCSNASGPGDRVLTLQVASTKVPCTGMFPTQCLQIRSGPGEPWGLTYGGIEGFTYEPGYEYTLRVSRRTIANPPADGSSVVYRLVAVLSRQLVTPPSP